MKQNYSQIALRWLRRVSAQYGIHIQHAENGGEHKVPNSRFRADGFCREINTVFEFHGTMWHGHPDHTVADEKHGVMKGKTNAEIYRVTLDRQDHILLYHNLVVMWQHEWKEYEKDPNKVYEMVIMQRR